LDAAVTEIKKENQVLLLIQLMHN